MLGKENNTSWPELTAILLARLGVLWLLVLISFMLPHDDAAFYALMGIAFIITIPYSLWLRNRLRSKQFASLQFIVDLLLVTGLVYFTGGIRSDLTLLYPLVILSAGIVGTPKQAAEITALGIITYLLMVTLLSNHWIVEYIPEETALADQSAGAALVLRGLTFAIFGGVSIYVAKRCKFGNTQDKELMESVETLLTNIPSPALLIDEQGSIMFATAPAIDLLGFDDHTLYSMKFIELGVDGQDPIPEKYGSSIWLQRSGEAPLPASYTSCDFCMPGTALFGSKGWKKDTYQVTLLTFTDLTEVLDKSRQLHQAERISDATRIAGELAHEIRTPLTAISASIQLLRRYEEQATAADWLPNSPRRTDRAELFNHIDDASRRMDTVIKNFIDFADFSPADLISIIKLDSIEQNEGYIDHLNTIGRGIKDGENTYRGR